MGPAFRRFVIVPLVLVTFFVAVNAASGAAYREASVRSAPYLGSWVETTDPTETLQIVALHGRIYLAHQGQRCQRCREAGAHFSEWPVAFIPDFIRVAGNDFLIDAKGRLVNTGWGLKAGDFGHRYRRLHGDAPAS